MTIIIWKASLTIIFLIKILNSNADLFTSIEDLQNLIYAEKKIPQIITKYINIEEKRLIDLKKIVNDYNVTNEYLKFNLQNISDPINAFQTIKQFSRQWNNLQKKMINDSTNMYFKNLPIIEKISIPTLDDLNGAITGLFRLQDTYKLDTQDLANGIIYKKIISESLTPIDCFEIGQFAFDNKDYYHTMLWMMEAFHRLNLNKFANYSQSLQIEVLEYLSFAFYKQGNLKHALKFSDLLYQIAPNHPRVKGNIKWYEDQLINKGFKRFELRNNLLQQIKRKRLSPTLENEERDIYEALCRNEIPRSVKETSKLYCYYKKDHFYLLLAPFKIEILRFNPLIVLFHNVISNNEIENLKKLAKPKLARATVQNSYTGKLEPASYRISKSAWFKETDAKVIKIINSRLHLMTNLNMETAEELQIANYGIGGHYDPHYDFAREEEADAFSDLETGNRIATMSKPEFGGGTVFTELKLSVKPVKNSALFWYNLYRNGKGDLRTRHAACPVLLGDKWVSNKWIHEVGQEFLRPCGLKISVQEQYIGDLGGLEPRYFSNINPYPIK